MTRYSPEYLTFAEHRYKVQKDDIIRWAKSDNPLLAQTCREIIEAAKEAGGGR